jgi:ribosome maturation factor RimP
MKRDDTISQIEAIAERVAAPAGIEIVEVELKGSGKHYLLRIYIDRPEGVTHADCELVSRQVGAILDVEDPIPGSYELEVSSPGVERPVGKWKDWQRFTGKKVSVVLKEALVPGPAEGSPAVSGPAEGRPAAIPAGLKHFDGVITGAEDNRVTVELAGGARVTFPFEHVSRANLKFEW